MTYIPMAGLAIYSGINVYGMVEEYKAGQLVNSLPGDWLLIFPIDRHLLDKWVGRVDHVMAAHALFYTGHTGCRALAGSIVTEKTVNP